MSRVLVTGGSGFVGAHCIVQLLVAGHEVRATVRSLKREAEVRAMVKQGGALAGDKLQIVTADLEQDTGWTEAASACDQVLHVASPFHTAAPQHEDELIVPAREGTLRVLRAARDAGVKRVVLTSSFAAIGYSHVSQQAPFDESTWTNLDGPVPAYMKSKTLAERAAWEFIGREGGGLELSVVNPVGIFGPALGPDLSGSIQIVQRLMDGALPGCPRIYFGVVDVRDVAELHLRVMSHPAAAGERFLAVAGEPMALVDVARALKAHLGEAAARVPKRQLPDWLVRIAAWRDPIARQTVPDLGVRRRASNAKARRVLGWAPRSNEEAIAAAGESLVRLGLVKSGSRTS